MLEVGSEITGVCKAYWFLEKAGIGEELKRSVIASANGEYNYEKLRASLCAIVPQVRRDADDSQQPVKPNGARWARDRENKVHAVIQRKRMTQVLRMRRRSA